jgi:hypothetical protein
MERIVNHRIVEFGDGREHILQHQLNVGILSPTPEEEDEFICFRWGMDDYTFMETDLFMDLA